MGVLRDFGNWKKKKTLVDFFFAFVIDDLIPFKKLLLVVNNKPKNALILIYLYLESSYICF